MTTNIGRDFLVLVDPVTGKQARFAGNDEPVNASSQLFASPVDLVLTPSGRILVADSFAFGGTGGVIAVDPNTGEQTTVSSNGQPINASSQLFNAPSGIALLPSGRILVVDRRAFTGGGVIAVDPRTGKQTELSSNQQAVNAGSQHFGDPRGGIVITRSGRLLVSDSSTTRGIISVDLSTGKQSKFSTNDQPVNLSSQLYEIPAGLTQSLAGEILVADQNGPGDPADGGVIGVDQGTGKQRAVSSDDQPVNSGSGFFSDPFGLAFALNGRLLVADVGAFGNTGCTSLEGCGGIISVDMATGKQKLLSSNAQAINAGSQHYFGPTALVVVPPRCQGRPATIVGTPASERIVGTARPDVIAARGGRDRIFALGGNDRVCAGAGNDAVRGGRGRDRLRGNAGRDRLFGGPGRDWLLGGPGKDKLRGGPGRDRLLGGPGKDKLRGGPGRDRQKQ